MSDGGGSGRDDPRAVESGEVPGSGTDDGGAHPDGRAGDDGPGPGDDGPGPGDDGPGPDRASGPSAGQSTPHVAERYREWAGPDRKPTSAREWFRWFRTVETGPVLFLREVLSSMAFVAGIGLLLFAISGVWPPMVAVQSGSMQPHMFRGDLVFIVEEHRFVGQGAIEGTGVVTYRRGLDTGYDKFGKSGDVIVYEPNGRSTPDPIIHRARFWVEDGENWYDEANKTHVEAENCRELTYCPAPNSGFITKGDNPRSNQYYDQAMGMSRPVKPAWIKGRAMVRVPWLGLIRLKFGNILLVGSELGRGLAAAVGLAGVSTRLVAG